ncbi:hypothetical protein Drorol1_Dr00001469 [Drosera rotundifolia]
MRAGFSTIQQTLTPEAASILNQSIAEATRRNHGQTTPLHVAAALLNSPSGYLSQACIRSHSSSSHPLQYRALELCFSVALERLPTAQDAVAAEPPISNALMTALKRAQAHQRRGCPEQQQQPLLAVKVELEQLVVSILDDPSVSRVMREAGFSSPAVKAAIQQAHVSQSCSSAVSSVGGSPVIGLGFRPVGGGSVSMMGSVSGRNLYANPRLQQKGNPGTSGQLRGEEVKKVIDVLSRARKRNPVLVGETEPEAVLREVLRRIEMREVGEGVLKNVVVMSMEKEPSLARLQMPEKIKELENLIEVRMKGSGDIGGVIVDMGDLKWLEDQPVSFGAPVALGSGLQAGVPEAGRVAVVEMGNLLSRFRDRDNGRVWLIGTATCETYLRCQIYHPTMENDWDLQVHSIAARSPLPGIFPRLGPNGIISCSSESYSSLKMLPTIVAPPMRIASEKLDTSGKLSFCPQCRVKYEEELAETVTTRGEKSVSEVKQEASRQLLPQWLQSAKLNSSDQKPTSDVPEGEEQDLISKEQSQGLQKKWSDNCLRLHPSFHNRPSLDRTAPTLLSVVSSSYPTLHSFQGLKPKLQLAMGLGESLKLVIDPERPTTPPRASPVTTDLVLGRQKSAESTVEMGCIEPTKEFSGAPDIDSFKKLLKGLAEKVWWQREAASAAATAVTQCKVGNGKRRGAGSKGDIWLLFSGPDRIGKKKMARALSELVCGVDPVTICLGSRRHGEESDVDSRGKTVVDRIAEAVRRNPFSVIVLQDIDEASALVGGSIRRAMERGRVADSYGREISLGNVIFILTTNGVPDNCQYLSPGLRLNDDKLASLAIGGWQLRLLVGDKTAKRSLDSQQDDEVRVTKKLKKMSHGLSFDLNQMADLEDERLEGSRNSSDLTFELEGEHGHEHKRLTISHDLLESVDDTIVFKPVDFTPIRSNIQSQITSKFSTIVGNKVPLKVEQEALEKILGGIWLGEVGLEAWLVKVFVPSIQRLKVNLPSSSDQTLVARLELDSNSESRSHGDWLPSRITVVFDGQ